jgi:hypothetical protein
VGKQVVYSSVVWSPISVDLSAHAGETVRLAFYHVANNDSYASHGWFVDDIELLTKVPEFTGTFEGGWGDWSTDNGIWEVGTPTAGPTPCYDDDGTQCAGTVLDGNYHTYADSRLISPTVVLPEVSGPEELRLQFWSWFVYSGGDAGHVQISVYDESTGWSEWANVGKQVVYSSVVWSPISVDLSAHAGETVRLGFYHVANNDSYASHGWFVDSITFEVL